MRLRGLLLALLLILPALPAAARLGHFGGGGTAGAGSYTGVCDTITVSLCGGYSTTHSLAAGYAGNMFELIHQDAAWTGTGYISGTTFTVVSTVTGVLSAGMALSAPASTTTPALIPITYITGGSGPYTVNNSQTAGSSGSPLTMAAYQVLDVGQANHLPDLSGMAAFCQGHTCLIERKFWNSGSGSVAGADLFASNVDEGGATGRADCTASIVVCAPLIWLDTGTNVWMTADSYPSGMELCAGANPTLCGTSGLPTATGSKTIIAVERPDMYTDCCANINMSELGATVSGKMFGIISNLYTTSFGCTAGVWCVGIDYEGFFTAGSGSANGPSQQNIYEARYLSTGPTSTYLINNSSIFSGVPPTTVNTGPMVREGLAGDRSTTPVYMYDTVLTNDGADHTALYNNLSAWYAAQSATANPGPLDVAFYVNQGAPDASNGYKSALIGNARAGYSLRCLTASYTGPVADLTDSEGSPVTNTYACSNGVLDPAATTFCAANPPCRISGAYVHAPWSPDGGNVSNVYDPLLKLTCSGGLSTCPTAVFNALNGEPVMHFSGGQCLLSGTMSGYIAHVLSAWEIGAVMRRTSGTAYAAGIEWGANSYYFLGAGNSANTAAFSNGQAFGSGTASDGHWHSLIADTTTNSTGTLYVDGVSVGTAGANAGEVLQSYVTVGCGWNGTSIINPLTGDIAEVWMQHRTLNAAGTLTSRVSTLFADQEAFWGSLPN